MKLLTSFTKLTTGEGVRLSYTYSEINEKGEIISQNTRGNFIVLDADVLAHLAAIDTYIKDTKLSD